MDNTHGIFMFIIFGISCISFALYIVSISTDNWVEAMATYPDLNASEEINYGLFSGSAIRQVLASKTKYDLSVVCDFSKSVCLYSCQEDSENRNIELNRILNGEHLEPCPSSSRSAKKSPKSSIGLTKNEEPHKNQFIPAGYWLCTLLFHLIATCFTATSGVFALINMVYCPIEPIFNVFGLYIWNTIGAVSSFLTIVLWPSLFHQHLIENIAVTDTLNSESTFISKNNASISFSYYITVIAFFFNLTNIGVLTLRIYIINRNAEPPTITIDKNDSPLEFY